MIDNIIDFLYSSYEWLKAIHIIAVISWMAGLLYLPRLFVYHTQTQVGTEMDEKFRIMEYKLLNYIMTPAMLVSLIVGLALILVIGFNDAGKWLHIKIFLLLFMFGAHGMMVRYQKAFAQGKNKKSELYFRVFNEVPTILMILIVILAEVKPF
jgi:putative membrane protein